MCCTCSHRPKKNKLMEFTGVREWDEYCMFMSNPRLSFLVLFPCFISLLYDDEMKLT